MSMKRKDLLGLDGVSREGDHLHPRHGADDASGGAFKQQENAAFAVKIHRDVVLMRTPRERGCSFELAMSAAAANISASVERLAKGETLDRHRRDTLTRWART